VQTAERLAMPPTATKTPEPPVVGSTEIYSPVYRVGRLDEGKEIHARIRIEDKPYDVRIDSDAIGAAFDAAKGGAVVPIQIVGGWRRDANNGLILDREQARIARIGADWRPVSGAEFLDAMRAAIPDAFDDLTDVLPGDIH
jgi:hypothetical protein